MSWRAPARSEDRGPRSRSLRRGPSSGRSGVGPGSASVRCVPGGRHRHGYTTPGGGGPLAGASEGLRPRLCGGTPASASTPLRSVPLRCPITGRTYAAHRPRWVRSLGLVPPALRLWAVPSSMPRDRCPRWSARAAHGRTARQWRGTPVPPWGRRIRGPAPRRRRVRRQVNPMGAAPCEPGASGQPPGCHPPGRILPVRPASRVRASRRA